MRSVTLIEFTSLYLSTNLKDFRVDVIYYVTTMQQISDCINYILIPLIIIISKRLPRITRTACTCYLRQDRFNSLDQHHVIRVLYVRVASPLLTLFTHPPQILKIVLLHNNRSKYDYDCNTNLIQQSDPRTVPNIRPPSSKRKSTTSIHHTLPDCEILIALSNTNSCLHPGVVK